MQEYTLAGKHNTGKQQRKLTFPSLSIVVDDGIGDKTYGVKKTPPFYRSEQTSRASYSTVNAKFCISLISVSSSRFVYCTFD